MVGSLYRTALLIGILLSTAGCQTANMVSLTTSDPAVGATGQAAVSVAASDPMPGGVPIPDAPPGYISFCMRYPDQCDVAPKPAAKVSLDSKTWQLLQQVDEQVNNSIWPEDDEQHFGRAEYWTIPTDGYGSCHDYALTKRKDLIEAGLPLEALRIAIVVTPSAERHAVLTVATDKGDYVLDNLRQDLVPWRDSGYEWVARQDPASKSGWESLASAGTTDSAALAATTTAALR